MSTQRTAPPTVYDVAAAAGVSIATVSRVLRSPDAVREGTRDRVQAAIRSLGYVPSGNARGLAGRDVPEGADGRLHADAGALADGAPVWSASCSPGSTS
jgi:LacI family transcriptional regulator